MTTGHISPEDLSLYAMQLLDSRDHTELHHHLLGCAECRSALASTTGDLALMALTADLHSPPAFARERLMKQVARERKVVAIRPAPQADAQQAVPTFGGLGLEEDSAGPRKNGAIRTIAPWLGWAAAAAMLLVIVRENSQHDSMRRALDLQNGQIIRLSAQADRAQQVMDLLNDQSAKRVSLTRGGAAPAPIGRATYLPQKGALLFMASNMETLPPYKTYELWLIPANGHDPIPAGTFQPDAKGNATILMPDLPQDVEAKAFGVTIEDQGGSQTPTLPIIMSGN